MAINKKLIHFKNKENFNREVANNNILESSIVFIQDSRELYTHGCVYKTVNWTILDDSGDSEVTIEDNILKVAGEVVNNTVVLPSGEVNGTTLIL